MFSSGGLKQNQADIYALEANSHSPYQPLLMALVPMKRLPPDAMMLCIYLGSELKC
jgi:hypothetical protein